MLLKILSIQKIIFLTCFLLFGLLLYKDVFSQRTLIPNFEPFPDTFHYIIPARNLVLGHGFNISRDGRMLTPQVAPLYSIFLIPFYSLNLDPRIFYFANIVLAFFGFFIFYKILQQISSNPWITGVSLFLFSTNYYLYWYPSLAMAENLLVCLLICGMYLLLLPVRYRNILLATAIALSFYLTKYASASLTGIYLLLYIIKIYLFGKSKRYFLAYLILGLLLFLFSGLYLFFSVHKMNIINAFFYYVGTLSSLDVEGIFSLKFLPANMPQYLNATVGNPTKVLWESTPLLPNVVALLGLVGLVFGSIKSTQKFFCISSLCLLISSILFMSTFYSFNARYILYVIPLLILGFTIFLMLTYKFLTNLKRKEFFYVFLLLFVLSYLVLNSIRLKNQIMLNIKYAETPWYYISILEMNKYFTPERIENSKKPIVISAVAPLLIDFFSNDNYLLLPLSYGQEFRSERVTVWGPNDYSDLIKLYKKYINNGYSVYVARYGLGNETETNRDYKIIEKSFNLLKVYTGCYEQCNIYKLELKE